MGSIDSDQHWNKPSPWESCRPYDPKDHDERAINIIIFIAKGVGWLIAWMFIFRLLGMELVIQ